jgi:hypothetical protein
MGSVWLGRGRAGLRLGAAGVAMIAATSLAVPSGAVAVAANQHALGFRGQAGGPNATSSSNLVDHGGKVLAGSHTYAIWWGNQSAWASDVQPGMASFFSGLNGTSFLNTGTQYMRGASVSSSFKGSVVDTSAPPKRVSASTLGNEVAKMFPSPLDSSAIYFVFTSNMPSGGNYCAWHSYATVSGQNIAVAYMPNISGMAGCDPSNPNNLTGSEGLRAIANVTSHEFFEAITDTLPGSSTYGWVDSSGSEIGDKCAWQFGPSVTLSNSTVWRLQEEWSNATSGCVQTS